MLPSVHHVLESRACAQAIDVEIEGEVQTCSFCVIEKELSAEQLRSTAITTHCPIHSYLFNASGELLYATHNATLSLNRAGARSCTRLPAASVRVSACNAALCPSVLLLISSIAPAIRAAAYCTPEPGASAMTMLSKSAQLLLYLHMSCMQSFQR